MFNHLKQYKLAIQGIFVFVTFIRISAVRFLPWPSSIWLSVKRIESINANTKTTHSFSHGKKHTLSTHTHTPHFDNYYRTVTMHDIPYLLFLKRFVFFFSLLDAPRKCHCVFCFGQKNDIAYVTQVADLIVSTKNFGFNREFRQSKLLIKKSFWLVKVLISTVRICHDFNGQFEIWSVIIFEFYRRDLKSWAQIEEDPKWSLLSLS